MASTSDEPEYTTLDLSHQHLSALPASALAALATLPAPVRLDLSGNRFTGLHTPSPSLSLALN